MKTNTTPTTIGIRELVRNLKEVKAAVARGETFTVHDHAEPVFTITPPDTPRRTKYSLDDLLDYQVATNETNLSKTIDDRLYG